MKGGVYETASEGSTAKPIQEMDHYPVNKQKVESLKASIKETTFWDNLLAREKNSQFPDCLWAPSVTGVAGAWY